MSHRSRLRFGVIGMSEGNGHPYSWSAIFNGYDRHAMESCPFPGIPAYLSQQKYPDDFLSSGEVSHIWTQEKALSLHIAAASRIKNVVHRPQDMLGQVDAILLARDDAENHIFFATPFLKAGIPIYIDKPLALRRQQASQLLSLAKDSKSLYSCTALRYANELAMSPSRRKRVGRVRFIDARVPKCWDTYAVHVIEPILCHFAEADEIADHVAATMGDIQQLTVEWKSGLITRFTSTGSIPSPISYTVYGDAGQLTLTFKDSFAAFRSALKEFVAIVNDDRPNIPPDFMLRVVDIIELGHQKENLK